MTHHRPRQSADVLEAHVHEATHQRPCFTAEQEMLGWLHAAADERAPVVLNPGAWSHYNYAVRDACAMLRDRLVEVHISNIHAREQFRHHSVVSAVATGVICGLGVAGYRLALQYLGADRERPD